MASVSPDENDVSWRASTEEDVDDWDPCVDGALHLLVLLQHVLTGTYFMVLAALHYTATTAAIVALGGAYMKLSAFVFGLIALLHWSPILLPCIQSSRRRWMHSLVRKVPTLPVSANARISLAHLVEVACETYVAYTMAHSIVQHHISLAYAVLLGINCVTTPWLVFLHSSFRKTLLVDAVDCFFNFMLCTCFPLLFFLWSLVDYAFLGAGFEFEDISWHVKVLPPARVLVTSSLLHIGAIGLPSVLNWYTLRRVAAHLRGRKARYRQRRRPSRILVQQCRRRSTVIQRAKASFTVQQDRRHVLLIVVLAYAVWGVVVLAIAVTATFARHSCPAGCEFAATPWLQSQCACVYFRFRCAAQGVPASAQVDDYIRAETLGDNLAFLHIQDCDVPRGLEKRTLAQFPNLFGLRLERTLLQSWDVPSALFPSLKRVDIMYSALTTVPLFLAESGPSLGWLFIIGSNISSLPEDIDVRWQSLFTLWLHESNLSHVPAPVTRLENLGTLGLTANAISSIPALASVTSCELSWVYLEFNRLTEVPSQLLTGNPGIELYLSGNPIASVTNFASVVSLAETPFCTSTPMSTACTPPCAPRCSVALQSDFMCEKSCNVSACAYDRGSCLV